MRMRFRFCQLKAEVDAARANTVLGCGRMRPAHGFAHAVR